MLQDEFKRWKDIAWWKLLILSNFARNYLFFWALSGVFSFLRKLEKTGTIFSLGKRLWFYLCFILFSQRFSWKKVIPLNIEAWNRTIARLQAQHSRNTLARISNLLFIKQKNQAKYHLQTYLYNSANEEVAASSWIAAFAPFLPMFSSGGRLELANNPPQSGNIGTSRIHWATVYFMS